MQPNLQLCSRRQPTTGYGLMDPVAPTMALLTCDKLTSADVVLHLTGAPSMRLSIAALSANTIAAIWLRHDGKSRGSIVIKIDTSITTPNQSGSISMLLKEALDLERQSTKLQASRTCSTCSSRLSTLQLRSLWLRLPLMAQ